MAIPTHVGSRELKSRLGRYLKEVRAGRTLIVTDRGEPVAELRPLPAAPSAATDEATAAAWERLYANGAVTRPTRTSFVPRRLIPNRGKPLSATVIEERGKGW